MSERINKLINENLEIAYENLRLSKAWKKKFKGEITGKQMIEGDLKTIDRLKEMFNVIELPGQSLR